jgi:hypothetical protein
MFFSPVVWQGMPIFCIAEINCFISVPGILCVNGSGEAVTDGTIFFVGSFVFVAVTVGSGVLVGTGAAGWQEARNNVAKVMKTTMNFFIVYPLSILVMRG